MWTMGETSIHFHVFSWGPEKERKKIRDFYFWVFLECGATSTRLREPGRPEPDLPKLDMYKNVQTNCFG